MAKIMIVIEIDVQPNGIERSELNQEISDNKTDLKKYFETQDDHWLNGLRWVGQKVKSISVRL